MKKFYLFGLFFTISVFSFSDYTITRGPDVGEIYFIGPTNSGLGLYHSTDFGQTAICVDNTFTTNIMSICADKTPGVVYYVTMQEGLYISYNYGDIGSWELRNGGVKIQINSGLIEGQIYSSFSKHSEDYGVNFVNHSYNGFFGSKLDVEIDNENNVGYVLVNKYGIPDSLFLLISYDNFENLALQNSFYILDNPIGQIRRGVEFGELFTYYHIYDDFSGQIKHSLDNGLNWNLIDKLNFSDYYIENFTGGRQSGEIYIMYVFINMAWQNAHTYIYHSLDYGKTFEVFHPFAKGNEPVLTNFSSDTTEGEMPFTVDFCNFSIGDIQQYEWDFDNDGIIDSYEETPVWTYTDTGYYSVRLTVIGADSSNTFLKENYIHVVKTTGIKDLPQPVMKSYPNPFSNNITFEINNNEKERKLLIYDNSGKKIKTLIVTGRTNKITWDGQNANGTKCKPGIYYVNLNDKAFFSKILLTN